MAGSGFILGRMEDKDRRRGVVSIVCGGGQSAALGFGSVNIGSRAASVKGKGWDLE